MNLQSQHYTLHIHDVYIHTTPTSTLFTIILIILPSLFNPSLYPPPPISFSCTNSDYLFLGDGESEGEAEGDLPLCFFSLFGLSLLFLSGQGLYVEYSLSLNYYMSMRIIIRKNKVIKKD